MFRLENVKYKEILDIKQLTIPSNKITCIVGKSGSGKTTLLKLLNKMISYTEGEIYYKNRPISKINSVELRRQIVMLPQNPIIFPGTIKDNLMIGLKFSEKPLVDDSQLFYALKTVELDKPLDEDADKLSGGESQRLALGRIILMKPDVVLLDEPSSALDQNTEHMVIGNMIDFIKRNNKTLVMVTHSNDISQAYADITIPIEKGKISE
ncbi:MAG: ABC transporter ATP-binding protein [Clostridia bacterium]|nr:ABC transporter ATP-binding protein [Clostridia bacterium]